MKRRLVTATAALAVVVLGGCGGESDSEGQNPADAAPTAGCTKTDTEELYVRELYDCPDGSVYLFNDNTARDNWRKVGESVGAVVLDEGDKWLKVKK